MNMFTNQVDNPEAVVAVSTTIPNTGHGHNFHICEPVGTVVTLWVQRECGSPSQGAGSPGRASRTASGTGGLDGGADGGGDSGGRGRGLGHSESSGRLSDIAESPATSFNIPEAMAEAPTSTSSTTAAAADDTAATATASAAAAIATTSAGASNAAADETPPPTGSPQGAASPSAMAALKLALTMPTSAVVHYKVWYTVGAVGEVKFTGGDGLNLAKLRRWASWSSGK